MVHPQTCERRRTRAAGNDGAIGSASGLHSLPATLQTLQLDYILTASRWASSVRRSHVRWGVSIRDRRFDHGLIECTWQVRLATKQRIAPTPDYATLKRDPIVAAAYDAALRCGLATVAVDDGDAAGRLRRRCEATTQAASALHLVKRWSLRKRVVSPHLLLES